MSTDLLLHCSACGIDFIWASEEQVPGAALPALCPVCRRLVPSPERRRGLVKWFSHAKGYGFITPPEGPEIFVHQSGLTAGQAPPRAGQLVEFTPRRGERGVQAEDVVVLEVQEGNMSGEGLGDVGS